MFSLSQARVKVHVLGGWSQIPHQNFWPFPFLHQIKINNEIGSMLIKYAGENTG